MLDIDHLRQWIGREEIRSGLLTPAIVDCFNATFDREGHDSLAPVMIHLCIAPPAASTAQLGPDGHPARGGFLPPVPLPRRMWAGGDMTFHDDIRVGEIVTRRSTVQGVVVKEGRSGPLCFVTVEHRIDSDCRPVLTERQDIVYRDVAASGTAAANKTPAAPEGTYRAMVEPSAPLLFRYSALTFNGHRIHYDAAFARNVEGYPGLVVHGPMQATMLVQFAQKIRGRRPERFKFRSLSPLFDNGEFSLNATEEGDRLKLWTARVDGPVAMEAEAAW